MNRNNRKTMRGRFFLCTCSVFLLLMTMFACPLRARAAQGVDMFRLYNPNSGEHFYTAAVREKEYLILQGWRYEGTGWVAPQQGDPVFRLYNANAGDHHYTMNRHEKEELVRLGWKDEGTGWMSDPKKSVALYRQYNPNAKAGSHNYTADSRERDFLVAHGWRDEGIAWYGLAKGTPVSENPAGRLHVSKTQLLDENNQPVVLQGYSTFGLNYAPQYVNENVFRFMKNTMHSQLIRLAMYTEESGGYCSGGNQTQLKALIDQGVQAAKKTGQYVIIDWHILSDGDPMRHVDQAKEFFAGMASKYKNETHVLYEICNEPNGVDWNRIKEYAGQVVPVIRSRDPQAVILVGTPTWSQDVDIAAQSPIGGVSNVMYTLHFYAATHKDAIRNKLTAAHQRGLPVFVSEFGISSADGNGSLDPASGDAWISLLNQYGISRVGWAINNKNEASSLFLPSSTTSLTKNDLSAAGKWFEKTYAAKPVTPAPDPGGQPEAKPQVSVREVNSWRSQNDSFHQYVLTLDNPSSLPVSPWNVQIRFSHPVTIDSSWNGSFLVSGNTMTIRPVDYNSSIPAGGSISEIGWIVRTSSDSLQILESKAQ